MLMPSSCIFSPGTTFSFPVQEWKKAVFLRLPYDRPQERHTYIWMRPLLVR